MNERPVCHRSEDLVTYLYNEASAAEAQDFASHIETCEACRAEFAIFTQVHESILLWRNEALGAAFNPTPQTAAVRTEAGAGSNHVGQHERKLSALAALREFFSVSPLWLRGATAFAALLLCILGLLAISRLSPKSLEVKNSSNDEKVYTQRQLEAEVKSAVNKKEAELKGNQVSTAEVITPQSKPNGAGHRTQLAANQPRVGTPLIKALTQKERVQLAADLRLTPGGDDEELPFSLPEQERPNP